MKKARWHLNNFSSDELNKLKIELGNLLAKDGDRFPFLQELLEKVQIDFHSRYLNREIKAWRRRIKYD